MKAEENYIIGFDVNEDSLDFAILNHIIHEKSNNLKKSAQEADVILLAAPISKTISLMEELNNMHFPKRVIVSDVSSVKRSIMNTANQLTNNQIVFIGGHPMAGSHKKGIEAAKAHLFENAIYVLTPTKNTEEEELHILKKTLSITKSKFVVLNSDEHDEMTGVVSHFPHLIASSLVHQAKKWGDRHTYLPNLAAGGFRDITRIASSNPELWQDIFHHNSGKLSILLDEWIEEMVKLKEFIVNNEKTNMISYLQKAKDYRDGLPSKKKGAIPSFYDIYVDIKDTPGALASVVLLLANKKISIKNIEILEIREGITGVLRISFYTRETQVKSLDILEHHGYEAMILD